MAVVSIRTERVGPSQHNEDEWIVHALSKNHPGTADQSIEEGGRYVHLSCIAPFGSMMNPLSCIFSRHRPTPAVHVQCEVQDAVSRDHAAVIDAYVTSVITSLICATDGAEAICTVSMPNAPALPAFTLFEKSHIDTTRLLASLSEFDPPSDLSQIHQKSLDEIVQRRVSSLTASERERLVHVFRYGRLVTASIAAAAAPALRDCLKEIQAAANDAAVSAACKASGHSAVLYASALDDLLRALSECGDEPDIETISALSGLLDSAVQVGAAQIQGCQTETYDDVIHQRLLQLEPAQFSRLLMLASRQYDPLAPAQLPLRLVAQAKSERRFAARELAKIFHYTKQLASRVGSSSFQPAMGENLSVSNYTAQRAGLALPLLDKLWYGVQRLDIDGGSSFIQAVHAFSSPSAVQTLLKAPLFSPDVAASFQACMQTGAALFRHCQDIASQYEPTLLEEWKDTLRYQIAGMRDVVRAVAQGEWSEEVVAPQLSPHQPVPYVRRSVADAIGIRIEKLTAALRGLTDALDKRAAPYLHALHHAVPEIQSQLRSTDACMRAEITRSIGLFISYTRLVSKVAAATGLHSHVAELGEVATFIVKLLGDAGHLLSNVQLLALRGCVGSGVPIDRLCDAAAAVRLQLSACLNSKSMMEWLVHTKRLSNALILLQFTVLRPNSTGGAVHADDGVVHAMVDGLVAKVVQDGLRQIDGKKKAALQAMLARPESLHCLAALDQIASADLDRCLGTVSEWCDERVVVDLKRTMLTTVGAVHSIAHAVRHGVRSADKSVLKPPTRREAAAVAQALEAGLGMRVTRVDQHYTISGLNNVEFYYLHGADAVRAVISDYFPTGVAFDRCKQVLLDPKSLTKGSVHISFPGVITAWGRPDDFLINRQLWEDFQRASFSVGDIEIDRVRLASAKDNARRQQPNSDSELTSEDPYLHEILRTLRTMCCRVVRGVLDIRPMRWVTGLLSQAMPAAITTLTMGRVIRYGWMGEGAFLKPPRGTIVRYVCTKPDVHADTVNITLEQTESISCISAPVSKEGGNPVDRELQGSLSRAKYDLSVDIVGGQPRLNPGALRLRYALISQYADFPPAVS